VTMSLKTFKCTCHKLFYFIFLFEKLHKCENKYEKEIFDHLFFGKKKSLDLQKIENHVGTFSFGFGLVIFKKNV